MPNDTLENIERDSTPLCVDLDGTLIYTDTSYLAVIQYMRSLHLFSTYRALFSLLKGRAVLKAFLDPYNKINPAKLSYNDQVVAFLKNNTQPKYLVTGSTYRVAKEIADYLGFFEGVIATTHTINLTGTHKASELITRFGDKKFDYMGNSRVDLKVWPHARKIYVVNAKPWVKAKAIELGHVAKVFD